jgi:hypothetical protein
MAAKGKILGMGFVRTVLSAFTTTGTTVEVSAGGLTKLVAAVPYYTGTPAAADGPLSINETITNGRIIVPSTGTITVTRVAGTTSGQTIGVLMIGE